MRHPKPLPAWDRAQGNMFEEYALPPPGLHRVMIASIRQVGYPEGLVYQEKERRKDPGDEALVS